MAATIPRSPTNSTVKVSIIDSTTRISSIPTAVFLEPVHPTLKQISVPAYSFLVEHQAEAGSRPTRLIFDLGLRSDYKNLPPAVYTTLEKSGWDVSVPSDVPTILAEHAVPLESISAVIWSHWHLDHTGDPSLFPEGTALIVGPGFRAEFPTGYPSDPEARVSDDALRGRELREIKFDASAGVTQIAGLRAFDYFGDGSFYLLDAPGHATGHMMGLARTTAASTSSSSSTSDEDTFILMGADTCHHAGSFRPSTHHPFPSSIDSSTEPAELPSLLVSALSSSARGFSFPCPGETLLEHMHLSSPQKPFYTLPQIPDGQGVNKNLDQAMQAREALMSLDARENVLTVIAHDTSLLNVVKFFPEQATQWRSKGWGLKGRWKFLDDFC